MADFLSYDPLTGIKTSIDVSDEAISIYREQDVEPMLDFSKELANTKATDSGIKNEMWLYAKLPPIVQMELRKKGIDIYSKDPIMIRRMLDEINANYSLCKTTQKTHR